MCGRQSIFSEFWWGNILDKIDLEDQDGDRRMTLTMYLTEIVCENPKWIKLIQDREQWYILLLTVL
jgi:hypothetical protein